MPRLLAAWALLPFIEPVGRNETTPPCDRIAEHRLVEQTFSACVDRAISLWCFFPTRQQTPAQCSELALALAHPDHRHLERRRNVVAGRQIGWIGMQRGIELACHLFN